jgi:hypothetical protein
VIEGEERSDLELPRDLELIAAECRELKPAIIVINPFSLDRKNHHITVGDEQSVCRLIRQLQALAQRLDVAIVLIVRRPAIKRGSGSSPSAGLARTVMLVGKDPIGGDRRVLAMVKTNLDATPRSLCFRVIRKGTTSTIQWEGQSDLDADALLRCNDSDALVRRAVEAAVHFLKSTLLKVEHCRWDELVALAAKEGICEVLLRQGRVELGLVKKVVGVNQCVWALPRGMKSDS